MDNNDIFSYLKEADENNDLEELYFTWKALGELSATNETKAYRSGGIYLVNEPESKLDKTLFLFYDDYFSSIDWNSASILDFNGTTILKDGVNSTYLKNISTIQFTEEVVQQIDLEKFKDFILFNKYKKEESDIIIIDDEQYGLILQPLGYPFVMENELEYQKKDILTHAIKPTLRAYFKHFPIIQEEVRPANIGSRFSIKFPEGAHGAVMWTTNGMSIGGSSNMITAFGYITTEGQYASMAMRNSIFGKPIRYNKSIPGYTGMSIVERLENTMGNMVTNATLNNIFKREKFTKIHKPDGLYAEGYTIGGGTLNIRWLKGSNRWDDIDEGEYEEVLQLARANTVLFFTSVRSQIKPDTNLGLNTNELQSTWSGIKKDILEKWSTSSYNKIYSTMRGGNAF